MILNKIFIKLVWKTDFHVFFCVFVVFWSPVFFRSVPFILWRQAERRVKFLTKTLWILNFPQRNIRRLKKFFILAFLIFWKYFFIFYFFLKKLNPLKNCLFEPEFLFSILWNMKSKNDSKHHFTRPHEPDNLTFVNITLVIK